MSLRTILIPVVLLSVLSASVSLLVMAGQLDALETSTQPPQSSNARNPNVLPEAAIPFVAIGAIALTIIPVILGIKAARRKGISPHWMWFGIHPVSGWIAYLIIRSRPDPGRTSSSMAPSPAKTQSFPERSVEPPLSGKADQDQRARVSAESAERTTHDSAPGAASGRQDQIVVSRAIAVDISDIQAILIGMVNWPCTEDEFMEMAWLLAQKWNPRLAEALSKQPPKCLIGGFGGASIEALVDSAHKIGERYPDCDLVIQNGGLVLKRRSNGKESSVEVLLLTVCKSRKEPRDVVASSRHNLTLIPLSPAR